MEAMVNLCTPIHATVYLPNGASAFMQGMALKAKPI
jgi:hypothetical protein